MRKSRDHVLGLYCCHHGSWVYLWEIPGLWTADNLTLLLWFWTPELARNNSHQFLKYHSKTGGGAGNMEDLTYSTCPFQEHTRQHLYSYCTYLILQMVLDVEHLIIVCYHELAEIWPEYVWLNVKSWQIILQVNSSKHKAYHLGSISHEIVCVTCEKKQQKIPQKILQVCWYCPIGLVLVEMHVWWWHSTETLCSGGAC